MRRAVGAGAGRERGGAGEGTASGPGGQLPVHGRRVQVRARGDRGPALAAAGPDGRGGGAAEHGALYRRGLSRSPNGGDARRRRHSADGDADSELAPHGGLDARPGGDVGAFRRARLGGRAIGDSEQRGAVGVALGAGTGADADDGREAHGDHDSVRDEDAAAAGGRRGRGARGGGAGRGRGPCHRQSWSGAGVRRIRGQRPYAGRVPGRGLGAGEGARLGT